MRSLIEAIPQFPAREGGDQAQGRQGRQHQLEPHDERPADNLVQGWIRVEPHEGNRCEQISAREQLNTVTVQRTDSTPIGKIELGNAEHPNFPRRRSRTATNVSKAAKRTTRTLRSVTNRKRSVGRSTDRSIVRAS